jgi:ribonucleotide reductase alpha subunit
VPPSEISQYGMTVKEVFLLEKAKEILKSNFYDQSHIRIRSEKLYNFDLSYSEKINRVFSKAMVDTQKEYRRIQTKEVSKGNKRVKVEEEIINLGLESNSTT